MVEFIINVLFCILVGFTLPNVIYIYIYIYSYIIKVKLVRAVTSSEINNIYNK